MSNTQDYGNGNYAVKVVGVTVGGDASAAVRVVGVDLVGHAVAPASLDVKSYGATGDGATDDTAAVALAVAAMAAGDTLFFPRGTYILSTPVKAALNNITVRGVGRGSVLKLKASTTISGAVTGNVIEVTSVSGWVVRDLAIDGNGASQTANNSASKQQGIYVVGSDHVLIEGVYTHDTLAHGVQVDLTSSYVTVRGSDIDGGNLYNVTAPGVSEGGILLLGAHCAAIGNHVRNWWKEIYVGGPDCIVSQNWIVHGTVQQDDANGIEIYQTTGIASYQGYWAAATAYTVNQTVIDQGRYWKAAGSSTGSRPSESNTANWTLLNLAYRCVVTGNLIENIWWEGIQVGTGSAGTVVANNEIRSYGLVGTPGVTNFGVIVNDPQITVAHNRISGFRVQIFGAAFSTGSITTSRHALVQGNQLTAPFSTSATGAGIYLDDGPSTVADNVSDGGQIRVSNGNYQQVRGNRVVGVALTGIVVSACPESVISGNTVEACTASGSHGLQISGVSPRCLVSGNVLRGNAGNGIVGLDNNLTITGNEVIDNGSSNQIGIQIQANECVLVGNTCTDTRAGGSRTQLYGIALQVTSANTLVEGNNLTNAATSALDVGGSTTGTTARGNRGYNPKTAVTQIAVGATTVAVTNTNPVDCQLTIAGGTITVIAVGGVTTGLTSGTFYVPVGQTVTVTYTVAPTSFVWVGC